MLIINFVDKIFQEKKRFFKRIKSEEFFERYNLRLGNKVFTVVNTSMEIDNIEIFRLVKSFKGKLLKTSNDDFNFMYSDMIFDSYQYNKRAILSTLFRNIDKYSSVCIEDYDFKLTQEIADIAKISKKICIIGSENTDLLRFCNICYLKLGLKVVLNDYSFKSDVYVNLSDNKNGDGIYCIMNNKEMLLYPDTEYYLPDENVNKLIELNVSVKDACAALEVRENYDVCWVMN